MKRFFSLALLAFTVVAGTQAQTQPPAPAPDQPRTPADASTGWAPPGADASSPNRGLIPRDILAVDYVQGFTAGKIPGQGPWPGVRLEIDSPDSPWGLELGYANRGKQYYSYDHGSHSWSGPMPWTQVKSGGVSEEDWPFYQTRNVLSPGLVFRGQRTWYQLRMTLGALIQFFVPADADKYYPDYQNQFHQYLGTTKTIFGNSLKFGAEGLLWKWMEFGADFAFEIPDWAQFYDAVQYSLSTYVQTNAHFELRVGVRL